jgi:hypothetical protein
MNNFTYLYGNWNAKFPNDFQMLVRSQEGAVFQTRPALAGRKDRRLETVPVGPTLWQPLPLARLASICNAGMSSRR